MIVSIHQPAYLPWLGYFDRIARSDVFIVLDNVQFERNSFTNRNKIKTANGPAWLTVPVRLSGHFETTIADIEIDDTQDWRRKHLRSIEQSYSRAPDFAEKFGRLSALYEDRQHRLAPLCVTQLRFWLGELRIDTPVLLASEQPVSGRKSDLVLALCRHAGATTYLSGPLGRGYLNENEFAEAGIAVAYHDFVHPAYKQQYGDFVPAMAIVDYWMNSGDPAVFASH
ncbi:MAG TPA: WbqC family protein [Pseudolabrys sp.]|nr:WbqC family protein [Pseudolabrys sp.]